jgi:excinuclease ABC subunit B
LFGDTVERIQLFDPVSGHTVKNLDYITIFPAKHFITTQSKIEQAVEAIKHELADRLKYFKTRGKLLEAQRLAQRTKFDIEMLLELGYCSGIENYSMHLSGRKPGQRPYCLIDYFGDDYIMVIDESHLSTVSGYLRHWKTDL